MYEPPNEVEILESFLGQFGSNKPVLKCGDCGSPRVMLRGFNLSFAGFSVTGDWSYECRECRVEKDGEEC